MLDEINEISLIDPSGSYGFTPWTRLNKRYEQDFYKELVDEMWADDGFPDVASCDELISVLRSRGADDRKLAMARTLWDEWEDTMRRKARRWRESYKREQMACFEVAAEFMAERYSNPLEDVPTLIWSTKKKGYVHRIGDEYTLIPPQRLVDEIEEFMVANRPRIGRFISGWSVYHKLSAIGGQFAEGSSW